MLPYAIVAVAATVLAGWLKHASVDLGPLHLGQFNLFYLIVTAMFLICLFGAQLYPGKAKGK
ncbi:MAG: hypothetical protein ACYC7E_22625 [Armatimonadota bacterium]